MQNFDAQIQRIAEKIKQIECEKKKDEKDVDESVLNFNLGPPLGESRICEFETKYGVSIPEDYRAFLTKFANGAMEKRVPTAPYEGIFSLEQSEEFHLSFSSFYGGLSLMSAPFQMFPDMSPEQYEQQNQTLCETWKEKLPDTYSRILHYCGSLVIGELWHNNMSLLVLNGPYRGKVVSIDIEFPEYPYFMEEKNFLDWYEHRRNKDEIYWFGINVKGNAETLRQQFEQSETEPDEKRVEFIYAFGKLKKLDSDSLSFLENLCRNESQPIRFAAVQILEKFDYHRIKPYLLEMLKDGSMEEKDHALMITRLISKDRYAEWQDVVLSILPSLEGRNSFFWADEILKDNPHYIEYLAQMESPNEDLQRFRVYRLARSSDQEKYKHIILRGLESEDVYMVRFALVGICGSCDPEFLPIFEQILNRFPYREGEIRYYFHNGKLIKKRDHHMPEECRIWLRIFDCLEYYGDEALPLLEKLSTIPEKSLAKEIRKEIKRRKRRKFWRSFFKRFFK